MGKGTNFMILLKLGVYPFSATKVDKSNYKEIMGADAN
jgi:hypothetical protein